MGQVRDNKHDIIDYQLEHEGRYSPVPVLSTQVDGGQGRYGG